MRHIYKCLERIVSLAVTAAMLFVPAAPADEAEDVSEVFFMPAEIMTEEATGAEEPAPAAVVSGTTENDVNEKNEENEENDIPEEDPFALKEENAPAQVPSIHCGENLYMGGTFRFTSDKGVIWSVRNRDVRDEAVRAIIDGTGTLRAFAEGIICVSVAAPDGTSAEREYTITGPRLTLEVPQIYVMHTCELAAAAEGFPDAVFTYSVRNESGDGECAAVLNGSTLRGVKEGSIVVTAVTTINGTSASVSAAGTVNGSGTVEMRESEPGITLSARRTYLAVGETETVLAQLSDFEEGDLDIVWTCEGGVTVNEAGEVTAVSEGRAVVTASALSGTDTVKAEIIFEVRESTYAVRGPEFLAAGTSATYVSGFTGLSKTPATRWSLEGDAAIVSGSGVLTGLKAGSVVLTGTSSADGRDYSDSVRVTVFEKRLIIQPADGIRKGDGYTFSASVPGLADDDVTFVWHCENSDILQVDENGRAAANKAGTALVECTASSGAFEGTLVQKISVTVKNAEELSAKIVGRGEIYSDETEPLRLMITSGGTDREAENVRWYVAEGASFARVTGNGVLEPIVKDGLFAGGTSAVVKVKASAGEYSAVKNVTILQRPAKIVPAEKERVIFTGTGAQLKYTVYPKTGVAYVTWSSADEEIAKVDDAGRVTGVAAGNTTVTALCGDCRAEFEITVLEACETVSITGSDYELEVGREVALRAVLEPAGTSDEVVRWESSDPDIAAVDADGNVIVNDKGRVTITCTTRGGKTARSEFICVVYSEKVAFLGGQVDELSIRIEKGSSVTLPICVLPEDTTSAGIIAVSRDSSIAAAEGNRVYGVATGVTQILFTAADGRSSAGVNVTVVEKGTAPVRLTLDRAQGVVKEGNCARIKVTCEPADAKTVWYSENEEVVTVDAGGMVYGHTAGTALVWCVAEDGSKISCCVTVKEVLPTSVKLSASSAVLNVDETVHLLARLAPDEIGTPANRELNWTTSNSRVALVSRNGVVKAMGKGTCVIRCTTVNGLKAECKVTVNAVPVTGLYVLSGTDEMIPGAVYEMSYGYNPANASQTKVYWTSSDRSVAKVDPDTGRVTALGAGECVISVHAADGSGCTAGRRIRVIDAAPERFEAVLYDVNGSTRVVLADGTSVEAAYGSSYGIRCETVPRMDITYAVSDPRVAVISSSGQLRTKGAGSCTVSVCAGGILTKTFKLRVTTDNTAAYRVLVIGQYSDPQETGFLPFSEVCVNGVSDAFGAGRIDGARYDIVTRRNITSTSEFYAETKALASSAQNGDVTVVYLLSHGIWENGTYLWSLSGNSSKPGPYLTSAQIVSALKGIKGHVVLFVTSCHSGGFAKNAGYTPAQLTNAGYELMDLVESSDNQAPAGSSMSIICSNAADYKSTYVDTAPSRAYEFFSAAIAKGLGRNLITGGDVQLYADADGDGYVTLKELTDYARTETANGIADYLEEYGDVGFVGDVRQNVHAYLSEKAVGLKIFGTY